MAGTPEKVTNRKWIIYLQDQYTVYTITTVW